MNRPMLRIFASSLLIASNTTTEAAPLQPTSPWNVNYTATSCDAKRRFGDVALVISPAPLGETMRILIEMPGGARRARQFPAQFDSRDGRGPEAATALVYPLSKKGLRGLYAVLPKASVERALASGEMEIRAGNAIGKRIGSPTAQAYLALGKTASLLKALETCLADLQKHWGMVDGKVPDSAVRSQVVGNLMGLFTSNDYPLDAVNAGQSGQTAFLLMIGTKGEVMDCLIQESSGIASLDAMGCQVIRERAKFQPATDAAGKPMIGTVRQSVKWVIQ